MEYRVLVTTISISLGLQPRIHVAYAKTCLTALIPERQMDMAMLTIKLCDVWAALDRRHDG